jgi:Fe-S-cluster containining protein
MFKYKEDCKADCCGIIPVSRQIYRKHKKKIPDFNINTIRYLKNDVLIITRTGFCAFLVEGKCSIYNSRPLVCKLYGIEPKLPCPYVRIDGTLRNEQEIISVQDKINITVDTAFLKYSCHQLYIR